MSSPTYEGTAQMTTHPSTSRAANYWEMSASERREASEAGMVDGIEYFMLYQINRGLRFLRGMATEHGTEEQDPVEIGETTRVDPEGCEIYDAIAALLITGAHMGFDGNYLLTRAIRLHNGVIEECQGHAEERRSQWHPASAPDDSR